MGVCAMYAYNSAVAAVEHAGLKAEDLADNPRYGIAGGSGGGSTASVVEMTELLETKGARKVGPFFVPRNMTNTITANVGVAFKLQGIAHSIASACATSADAIGYAYNLIALGKQDLMLAGGGEEDHWSKAYCLMQWVLCVLNTTTHLKQRLVHILKTVTVSLLLAVAVSLFLNLLNMLKHVVQIFLLKLLLMLQTVTVLTWSLQVVKVQLAVS